MEKLCIKTVEKIQNLRKKGLTYKEISEQVGVSRTCCRNYCNPNYITKMDKNENLSNFRLKNGKIKLKNFMKYQGNLDYNKKEIVNFKIY